MLYKKNFDSKLEGGSMDWAFVPRHDISLSMCECAMSLEINCVEKIQGCGNERRKWVHLVSPRQEKKEVGIEQCALGKFQLELYIYPCHLQDMKVMCPYVDIMHNSQIVRAAGPTWTLKFLKDFSARFLLVKLNFNIEDCIIFNL